jgi:large-conductance mechanosensitive channel
MDFVIGIVIGAAFSPFWMKIYTMFIKPQVDKLLKRQQ